MLKKSTGTNYNNKLRGHFISWDAFHVNFTLIWLTQNSLGATCFIKVRKNPAVISF